MTDTETTRTDLDRAALLAAEEDELHVAREELRARTEARRRAARRIREAA